MCAWAFDFGVGFVIKVGRISEELGDEEADLVIGGMISEVESNDLQPLEKVECLDSSRLESFPVDGNQDIPFID